MRTTSGIVPLAWLTGAPLLALPLAASAQTVTEAATPATAASSPEVATLDRVLIRARGRDEALQGVPMSVRAFSAQAVEERGIRKPGDFVALIPNLSLVEAQSVGTSFMTIRGITQVRNGDAPMAVVVDGVEQVDAKQFTQDLFDIQRIEVLRGPQGALYGRQAVGGAILITTRQPTDKTTGFVDLGYATGNEKTAQGALSGALVKDQLFYRLAASITDRDGYFENLYLGRKADPYRDRTFRGLLKWDVSDRLSIDLRSNYVRDHGAGAATYRYQPTHLWPTARPIPTTCSTSRSSMPMRSRGPTAPTTPVGTRGDSANSR